MAAEKPHLIVGTDLFNAFCRMPVITTGVGYKEFIEIVKYAHATEFPDEQMVNDGRRSIPLEHIATFAMAARGAPSTYQQFITNPQIQTLTDILTEIQTKFKNELRVHKMHGKLNLALQRHFREF